MIKEIFICLRDGFKELFSKENLHKYLVYGFLALPLVLLFIGFFCVPSKAYSVDSDGNLISDNLYNIGDYSENNNLGVSFSIHNQTLILNGTSIAGSWNNRPELSLTLNPGTYTMQWFTNYVGNNIGFGLRSSGTGFTELYQLNTQRYKTFTISETTTFTTVIWWQASGLTFNNVSVSCMVYEGNYKAYNMFEPYGVKYYSESNYNQAYNQGVNSVFDGLRDFNAIQSFYSISTLFYSTDGGSTYSNLNSLGYTGQYVVDGNLLVEMQDSHDWAYGSNIIYYLDIQFTTPIYIANLYLPSIQRPNPVSVQFSDFSYDFNYTMVDGVGYFVTRNIYKITDNLRFYFTAYADMPHEFEIIIKGFNNAIDTYESGFNDGVASLQSTIDGLNENIQVLKNQNATLKTQLEHGNSSWTSLFFAMADTPFKTASNFLGFEIFGVNLFNALIGFITILAIFWVFKRLIK